MSSSISSPTCVDSEDRTERQNAWRDVHASFSLATLQRLAILFSVTAYLWFFYCSPIPAFVAANGRMQDRLDQHLTILSSPLSLVESWCGGDWGRFQFFDRLAILFFASLILVTSYLFGNLLLRPFRFRTELSKPERVVLAFGLGLHALSLVTLAFGLAGQLHNHLLFAMFMVSVVIMQELWTDRSKRQADQSHTSPKRERAGEHIPSLALRASVQLESEDWLSVRWLWLVMPFTVWIVLAACLPPWHFDARVYHLQVPREWLEQGRISFLPHNVYGNMPLGAEMHALLAMVLTRADELGWWGGALAGKVVMSVFAPLTALALYAVGCRFFNRTAGIVAAVVYVSIPWVSFVSSTGLNEGASAFYWLLAVCCVMRWSQIADRRMLMLAGVMIGAAVSCKYPAILFLAVPLFLAVAWRSFFTIRENDQPCGRWGVMLVNVTLLGLLTLASCGLWLGKNWVQTGNPSYPLLFSWFGGETRTAAKDEQWTRAHAPLADATGARFSFAQGTDAAARILWRSNGLSPLLWPLLGLAFFVRSQRKLVFSLAGFLGFVVLAWWLTTHRFDRFLVPLLPLVALLCGVGVAAIRSVELRRVALIGLLVGVSSCFLISSSRVLGDNRILVSLTQLRADDPQSNDGYFSRVNPVHRLLNGLTPQPTNVLLVGDSRPFDLELPTLYNTCFDDCLFERLLRNRSRDERLAALREQQISHVFISWSEITCLRQPGEYGFTMWLIPELVHRELIGEQRLLKKIEIGWPAEIGELFAVE